MYANLDHRQTLKSLIRTESYESIENATQCPPLIWAVRNGNFTVKLDNFISNFD